jgi:tetratricopeptide (TPR) repeat protein
MTTGHRRSARCSEQVRERGRREAWNMWRTVWEIHTRCEVSLLAAHRLARGWTLKQAVVALSEVRLTVGADVAATEQMLCAWERDRVVPSLTNLDLLCRLYATRPDRLGFLGDYGEHEPDAPAVCTCGARRDAFPHGGAPVPVMWVVPVGGEGSLPMLPAMDPRAGGADIASAGSDLDAAELAQREDAADRYGNAFPLAAAPDLLGDVVADFAAAQRVLVACALAPELRRRGYRLVGRLAGLAGVGLVQLGELEAAEEWFDTGQSAADRAEDAALRAWLMVMRGLPAALWGSAQVGLERVRVGGIYAGSRPCAAQIWAPLLEAQALARRGRAEDTEHALRRARIAFSRHPELNSDTVFGFSERYLYWLTGRAYTYLGNRTRAQPALEHAVALTPVTDDVGRALMRLEEAVSLAAEGEITPACRLAGGLLAEIPGYRNGLVRTAVLHFLGTVPGKYQRLGCMRDLRVAASGRSPAEAAEIS